MNLLDYFHDPFLRGLDQSQITKIQRRMEAWGLLNASFSKNVDNWFGNFERPEDKQLAMKLFHQLEYYDHKSFSDQLERRYTAVKHHMRATNNTPSDIVVVTPNGGGDSADRHAYDLIKQWDIPQGQVCAVGDLSQRNCQRPIFIVFNDTHGTGDQFLREMWPHLSGFPPSQIFVLAIAISKDALKKFRQEMPGVHVLPRIPVVDVWSSFTGDECNRIRAIGEEVYPKHPMGYGEAGLLVAYYFQCPNNTLPIIWADSTNNDAGCEWSPLFPYKPKKSMGSESQHPTVQDTPSTKKMKSPFAGTTADANLSYEYRAALLDLDLGLTNLSNLTSALNQCQRFFHFTCPPCTREDLSASAVLTIEGQKNLSVYEISQDFFDEFDELAVDVVACFTRYPLAFREPDGGYRYNYFSGPSNIDSRCMFISVDQLISFVKTAECSFEEGLTQILVSQLAVYLGNVGYHKDILGCPMDFCEIRADIVEGLKKRCFCPSCVHKITNSRLLDGLNAILRWSPR